MCHPKHDLAHSQSLSTFSLVFSTLPPASPHSEVIFYSYYAALPSLLKVFVRMLKENCTSTPLRLTVIMRYLLFPPDAIWGHFNSVQPLLNCCDKVRHRNTKMSQVVSAYQEFIVSLWRKILTSFSHSTHIYHFTQSFSEDLLSTYFGPNPVLVLGFPSQDSWRQGLKYKRFIIRR